jgi:hypothetical protein
MINYEKIENDYFANRSYEFEINKHGKLFKLMLNHIRRVSENENISENDYVIRLNTLEDLFENLKYSIHNDYDFDASEKEIWEHKNIESFNDFITINKSILIENVIEIYLKTPYLHNKELNYIFIDLLLFIEPYYYKRDERLLKNIISSSYFSKIFKIFMKLSLICILAITLLISYSENKTIFILIFISIISYAIFKKMNKEKKKDYFEEMIIIYEQSEKRAFNKNVLYELCLNIRRTSTFYDGILFDLLKLDCN